MIDSKAMLNEIKSIYDFIKNNHDKGSLLGPATSALMKLNQDIYKISVYDRAELQKEIGKLRLFLFKSLEQAKQLEENKEKIIESNRRDNGFLL